MSFDTAPAPIADTTPVSDGSASAPANDDALAAEILTEASQGADDGDDSAPGPVANTAPAANTTVTANTTTANTVITANTTVRLSANTVANANAATANTATDPYDIANVPAKNSSGRPSRIPHEEVVKISDRSFRKGRDAAVAEFEPRIAEYEQERQGFAQFEQAITTNPEGVLRYLVQTNPAFSQYLAKPGQAPAQNTAATANTEPMPQPDLDLGNGSRTYSQQGLINLLEWQARQTETRVSQRFAPIEQRERAMQERHAAQQEVHDTFADAMQNWPGFKEHEAEIQAAFAANRRLTHKDLPAVYRHVVFGKLAQGRDAMRAELIREIQAQPRSTSAPVQTAAETRDESRPRNDDDLAAEILREARR